MLFYCCTPCAFHIIILKIMKAFKYNYANDCLISEPVDMQKSYMEDTESAWPVASYQGA